MIEETTIPDMAVTVLVDEAKELQITNPNDFMTAIEYLQAIKEQKEAILERHKKAKIAAHLAHKAAVEAERAEMGMLPAAEEALRTAVEAYIELLEISLETQAASVASTALATIRHQKGFSYAKNFTFTVDSDFLPNLIDQINKAFVAMPIGGAIAETPQGKRAVGTALQLLPYLTFNDTKVKAVVQSLGYMAIIPGVTVSEKIEVRVARKKGEE